MAPMVACGPKPPIKHPQKSTDIIVECYEDDDCNDEDDDIDIIITPPPAYGHRMVMKN